MTFIPNLVKIGQLMQKLEVKCIHRSNGQGRSPTLNAIFMCQNQLNDKQLPSLARCHKNELDVTATKIGVYSTNV